MKTNSKGQKPYDIVIVGSGLFGSVMAHRANEKGLRSIIVEKREHIGGNIYCEKIEGINVHKYGAHIFHTSDKTVWDFVNRFVDFNRYTNSPIANYKGCLYNLPFNMNTFHEMWGVVTPEEAQCKLDQQRAAFRSEIGNREPNNLEEQAKLLVGADIYNILIKEYTEKQWGRPCSELPAFIIRRLPLRFIYDNNYFNDRYQGIPEGGYNELISKLIRNSEIILNNDFFSPDSKINNLNWKEFADRLIYTGPIDQYFEYCFGKLEYRTVRFETDIINTANFQGNAVVNYTSLDIPYTRIIEHKHFESFGNDVYLNDKTVISKEYSSEYTEGAEPFYPINDEKNDVLAEKYRQLALKEPGVIFGGRLANYKYYDMAPVINLALQTEL